MKLLTFTLLTLSLYATPTKKMLTMEEVYLKNACNSCHGMYGEGMGGIPRLQDQKEEVLYKRLKALQQGKTRTANGGVMISFAKALDENQTLQMAKYLSKLKTVIADDRYDEAYDPNDDGGS
jgi:cytochrome c553